MGYQVTGGEVNGDWKGGWEVNTAGRESLGRAAALSSAEGAVSDFAFKCGLQIEPDLSW